MGMLMLPWGLWTDHFAVAQPSAAPALGVSIGLLDAPFDRAVGASTECVRVPFLDQERAY
jgi:hypothetical protein